MSSTHVLTCPVCHSALLIESRDSIGGQVMPNLVLLDSAAETPAAATARTAWELSQDALEAAQAKLDTAVAALESARQATPPDDAKVIAAEADVSTAKSEFDAAVIAEAAAQVAYEKAASTPPPPPVVPLPAGTFTGDLTVLSPAGTTPVQVSFTGTSDSDEESESAAVAQAQANVAAAQTALDQANAAKTAAGALTPPDPAAVTAAQAGVDAATANKATADKALADAKAAQVAEEKAENTTTAVTVNG